jgi:hypothetical protein
MFDEPPGSHEICPVCFWEDDRVQLRWPDWAGGANTPSLIDAQRNVARFGACQQRLLARVRPAGPNEPVELGWRPIDVAVDNVEARTVHAAPWPSDLTTLYWWRSTFWRDRLG